MRKGSYIGDFEQLFYWQLDADGVPPVLHDAEALARGEKLENPLPEAEEWLLRPGIRESMELEPRLGGDVLGPYYTFSRDRLTKAVTAARLPSELQRLLLALQSDIEPTRVKAIAGARALDRAQLAEVLAPLLQVATSDLSGAAAKAMVALAEEVPDVAAAMFASLEALPAQKITANFPLQLRVKFKDDPRVPRLLERWEEQGAKAVKRQASRARKPRRT